MIGVINMQKYTCEHGISDKTLELICHLNSRGYTTHANMAVLLDVALVRGIHWVDSMYSSTPFPDEAFQRLVGMYVLTSTGDIRKVENIFPIHNTKTTYAVKFANDVNLYMFSNNGKSQDIRIVNVFESDPNGEPTVVDETIEVDKQDVELQPKAVDAEPYKTLGSQLCTFDSNDDDEKDDE